MTKCFKAYDIRGRIPDELNAGLAAKIGAAMATQIQAGPVVLGHDVRLTSPSLQAALANGLHYADREVIDIGLCGTEEVYFQTSHLGAAGGVMVTASHNPIDYNGMKLVRDGSRPISGDTGLSAIRDIALNTSTEIPASQGKSRREYDKSAYIAHLLGYVDTKNLKPLKIVVNAGNGGAGLVVDELARWTPLDFVRLQHQPDGHFPNGIPNPLLPDHRATTANAVRSANADFGVAWDGDFDRCFFYDADGRFIEGYYVVGLLAKALLASKPGSKIIHDPRLVWNTIDVVQSAGGIPIMSKTGHAFIKERMRAEDALYGGEMSAHHYFRSFNYCDSGMIPWLLVAHLLSNTDQSLAEMVDDRITAFPCSGEINFTVDEPQDAVRRVMGHFARYRPEIDHTDGVSADFGEWRFNLRQSNTEPLLRLNVEARNNSPLVAEKVEEIRSCLHT
ncbi:MAG: phosphomannomutase [Xanthomonadales bacterium]|nr:phosphomannomutase [Xanthomonadales bacterium]